MISYRLPNNHHTDCEIFADRLREYIAGAGDPIAFKALRVPFGVYEQRIDGTYMARIRCAAGIITPRQLRGIAALAQTYGRPLLHLTTRQEVQIHDIAELSVLPALFGELAALGLSTRGGGGNTVRNITAAPDAGIDPEEVFDVSPYAVALTTKLIAAADSWNLPRKYKIAFSGSAADKGLATLNDLGFIARRQAGVDGFQVFVAGGMGAQPTPAMEWFSFIPATQVYAAAQAVKTIFLSHGNRKNRHQARLRFLRYKLGEDALRQLLTREFNRIAAEPDSVLALADSANTRQGAGTAVNNPAPLPWRRRYVRAQKQPDLYAITVPVWLGDITSEQLVALADAVEPLGEHTVRLTQSQQILLRNIHRDDVDCVYARLRPFFADMDESPFFGALQVCAGATTCRLGICNPRGAAQAMRQQLQQAALDLDPLAELRICLSGCPNSCGQHPIADIGAYGKALRGADRMYPAYAVVAGARVHQSGTEFSRCLGDVPARDLPAVVESLCSALLQQSQPADVRGYLARALRPAVSATAPRYAPDTAAYYRDWGSEQEFSLRGRGAGECSAGVFDIVERDFAELRRQSELLRRQPAGMIEAAVVARVVALAARALLITQGMDAADEAQAAALFERHFINAGWIDAAYQPLITLFCQRQWPELTARSEQVLGLAAAVQELYRSLDDSLRLPARSDRPAVADSVTAPARKDLRGVGCPLNFVKAKMALHPLPIGALLELWLDDGPPIENVPGSLLGEGHAVERQSRDPLGHWVVVVRKQG